MKFWDASAIVPLLIHEASSDEIRALFESDSEMAVWWSTAVECASGIARLRREGVITAAEETTTLELLDMLQATWMEILPGDDIRARGRRLLRVHPLRAADAMQLAAALEWKSRVSASDLITLDERLAHAARLEGFTVPL